MTENPKKSTFGQRLRTAMTARGVARPADLARMINHTPQQVDRWLNNKTRNPRAVDIFKIGDALKVSARWLLFNQGSMGQYTTVTPDERDVLTIYHALPKDWRDDWVQMGLKFKERALASELPANNLEKTKTNYTQ